MKITKIEGVLLCAILALGMVGSLYIYEIRLAANALSNQEWSLK